MSGLAELCNLHSERQLRAHIATLQRIPTMRGAGRAQVAIKLLFAVWTFANWSKPCR